ncbi:MAG: IgGFc-binding protein [Deltaproteobacteria bacterium]|nr:IgGFc-binding protein [Deltaproteobacteria bacterium]
MKRALLAIVIVACGPSPRDPGGGAGDDDMPGACVPGVNKCVGHDIVTCNPDGTLGEVITACGDLACSEGQCLTECALAAASRSYVGCEFWPVDLDNAFDALGAPNPAPNSCTAYTTPGGSVPAFHQNVKVCDDGVSPFYLSTCDWNDSCPQGYTCQVHDVCGNDGKGAPFAIVVSNPDPMRPANVTLSNDGGITAQVMVPPQSVQTLIPNDLGFADQSLDFSGIETKAYHMVSDHPIIAYQFNPLNNVGVFTNDGSLLIPASAYDTNYYVLTHKSLARRPLRNDWSGYLTVVANGAPTTVTVTATARTLQGTGVPAMVPNQQVTFTIAPFQTLTLEAEAPGDLTGTKVECTPACGVFAGHEAINLDSNGTHAACCADHLEDMVFPASTWGAHYIVAASAPRTQLTWDLVRVVAQKSNTTLSIFPQVNGCNQTLQPGQFCDFFTQQDVEIVATEPILVGHFLTSNGGLDADSGDPALSFAIPVAQYRKDYTLLVPAEYDANFFAITVPAGGGAMLDGIDVTGQLTNVGTGAFRAARIPVTAGQHRLECTLGCGVEAEGWSEAVSYLYAGGLNFEQIVLQ